LSSLAEHPKRIKDIFCQNYTNKAGIYAVQLYLCGEKHTVVVDDRFPFDVSKNKWAFSRTSHDNEIWVLILEKAWAKVFGSYQRIEAGTSDEALHPLSGCPTKNLMHDSFKNKDHLWDTILSADKQNFPMCTAAASQMEDNLTHSHMKKAGLVDGHAYSLISVKEIETQAGDTVRLCLVRNPWGKKEWTGDWSDHSDKWDDFIRAQIPNFKQANDGCFWMSFEDYDKFFYITTVCYYNNRFKHSQVASDIQKGEVGMALLTLDHTIRKPVCLTLDQLNARYKE
jgi:hypothetical protein